MENNRNFELNSNEMKSASAKCISSYKQVTYEMEKITDIVIRLIESKNNKNPNIKTLKTFKDKLEELKKYSMTELKSENFIIDIKDVFGRISKTLKEFRNDVIICAKKNGINQVDKIANKLPGILINLFENFNSYLKATSKEVNRVKDDIEVKKDKLEKINKEIKENKERIKNKKEPLHEGLIGDVWNELLKFVDVATKYNESLNTAQNYQQMQKILYNQQFHGKTIEGFAQGLTNAFSKIFGAFSLGSDKISDCCKSLEKSITELKTAAQNDNISEFLSDSRFTNILGGITAIAGIYYLLKKGYEVIKRKLSA